MERSLWRGLQGVFFRYRRRFLLALFFVLISNTLLIVNPLLFKHAVASFDTSDGGVPASISILIFWVLGLISIALLSARFKYLMRISFISLSRDVELNVRSRLFEKIQAHSLAFFDRHRIGDLMSRLSNDIGVYREVLGPGVMYPCYFITLFIPAILGLFSISPTLALMSLIPITCLPLMMLLISSKMYKLSLEVHQSLAKMSTLVHENYSGIRITKSYGIEKTLYQLFHNLCERLLKLNVRLEILQGLFFPFLTFITRLVTLGLVIFGGTIIIKAWGTLSKAEFISFMWIQSYLYQPVLMLGWVLPIYERGRAAYDRLVEIDREPVEIRDNPTSILSIPVHADLQFSDLSFKYLCGKSFALRNFNLHIKGGEMIGITGPVGSGKTTLLKLLNREYEIPYGHISIGGYDIHEYSLENLRKGMVTVEQLPFLFSKTISENVAFGVDEASHDALEKVAKMADIHDTILLFPEQYDTLVGERGVTLSGGQKQRIAIARALLVNRSILLLDDIFSAVDAATEKRIFASIQHAFSGKTVILVTHRISILERMERIIYMQEGTIVEEGSPQELLAKKGLYAALYELQRLTDDQNK